MLPDIVDRPSKIDDKHRAMWFYDSRALIITTFMPIHEIQSFVNIRDQSRVLNELLRVE